MTECCDPLPLLALPPRSDRLPLIHEAFRLEWLTIGWMTVEAVVSIVAGVTAGSLVLVAFGFDSVIELASAGVLMWRLSVELRHGQVFSERAERIASRIGGALLFALAAYVTVAAVWHLWKGAGEEFSWPGFIVALIASPPRVTWRTARSPSLRSSEAAHFAPMRWRPSRADGCLSSLSSVSPLNGLSARGGLTA